MQAAKARIEHLWRLYGALRYHDQERWVGNLGEGAFCVVDFGLRLAGQLLIAAKCQVGAVGQLEFSGNVGRGLRRPHT